MNRRLYILIIIVFVSCKGKNFKETEKKLDDLTNLEKRISNTFSDVDSLLKIDNGSFWNKKLYGPIIVIDPETRIFYSNENNKNGDFEQIGSIYKDSLPPEMNIANTAMEWNGKKWSMIMLPLPNNKASRRSLIVHELFHRIQTDIGFNNLQELDNGHLDTYDGRLLLKFELQALEKALISDNHTESLLHIKNALTFRNRRQSSVKIKNAENSLELNEGLAEYTALLLSGRNATQIKSHLVKYKNEFYTNPTFVRSFAYHTIPLYGYLLSSKKPHWHREISMKTNLTDYFMNNFEIGLDDNSTIQQIAKSNTYNYSRIVKVEAEREKKRIEKIETLKKKFTLNKTLELPFHNMNISFDPRNIVPLVNLGTVYPNLHVADSWGILTVENDALITSDWSKVILSEPIEISTNFIKGDGWQLALSDGWNVRKANGKYQIVKK